MMHPNQMGPYHSGAGVGVSALPNRGASQPLQAWDFSEGLSFAIWLLAGLPLLICLVLLAALWKSLSWGDVGGLFFVFCLLEAILLPFIILVRNQRCRLELHSGGLVVVGRKSGRRTALPSGSVFKIRMDCKTYNNGEYGSGAPQFTLEIFHGKHQVERFQIPATRPVRDITAQLSMHVGVPAELGPGLAPRSQVS